MEKGKKNRAFAALLYLGTGLVCVGGFSWLAGMNSGEYMKPTGLVDLCAAYAAPAVFLVGAILALWKPRFASAGALIGAGLAWPYFYRTEVWHYHFANSWVDLNLPPPNQTFGELRILAISLLILATVYSLSQFTPDGWRIGKRRLKEKIWPSFAVWFVAVCGWYFSAVTPYRIPIYDLYGAPPLLYVVHVNKRGLYFHETVAIVEQDGRFYLLQDDRRLFEYSFQETSASGVLPEGDEIAMRAAIRTANLGISSGPRNVSPWTWSADRWFVYSERDPRWSLTNVDDSRVPKGIHELFEALPPLPKEEVGATTLRDVCLGFCFFQGPPLVTH